MRKQVRSKLHNQRLPRLLRIKTFASCKRHSIGQATLNVITRFVIESVDPAPIGEGNDQILHNKINKQYPKRIEEKMSLSGRFKR